MRFRLLVVIAALLAAPPTHAQYWSSGMNYNNPWSAGIDQTLGFMAQNAYLRRRIASGYADQAKAEPKKATYPFSASDFKPAGPRFMPRQYVESLGPKVKDPDKLIALLDQGMDAYERIPDVRKHNVAYALTALIGSSLQIRHGKKIPDAKAQEMARDINDSLAAKPGFRKLSARDRQRVYETSLVTTLLMLSLHEQGVAQGNEQLKEQARQIAASVLTTFGVAG